MEFLIALLVILCAGVLCLGIGLYLHFKDMKRVLFFQQKKFDDLEEELQNIDNHLFEKFGEGY